MNEKAVFLMDNILNNEKKLEGLVFKEYKTEDISLIKGFKKVAQSLADGSVDTPTRTQQHLQNEKRFVAMVKDAYLVEKGFVNEHKNYEYEWYLHIEDNQKDIDYLKLFINRVLITTVRLELMIKDYVEREKQEEILMVDPVELVSGLDSDTYRSLLNQIITDSNQRVQAIKDNQEISKNGVLSHTYVSDLYGEVSDKELVNYAIKISFAADDYAVIALDQKIDDVMKILAGTNPEKEMDILLGLGYLLDLYNIDFEETQTSHLVEQEVI